MSLSRIERIVQWMGGAGVLAFAITMFVGLSSAARHAKGRESGHAPGLVRWTRSHYGAMSLVGFGLLFAMWQPLPLRLPKSCRVVALALGAPLYFAGLGMMLWGRFTLGKMYNVSTAASAQLFADHELVMSGPFAYVRHPMYMGGLLTEVGALLLYRTWAAALIAASIPSLLLRARREEDALSAEFGDSWAEYSRRVPAFIPRLGTSTPART